MRRRDDALAAAGAAAALRPPNPKRETLQEYLASAPLPPRRRGREDDGPSSNDDGDGPGADARERDDDARGGPSSDGADEGAAARRETLPLRDDDATDPAVRPRRCDNGVWDRLRRGKEPWVQCLTIYVAAWLTYSYDNAGDGGANVQVAIMTVIALVAATPLASTHLIPAAIGAFVGGQSVIGSVGPIEDHKAVRAGNYLWLFLLSVVVGTVWCFVIAKLKILDGYAGRLGTTTFVGMNLVMLTAFGPLGVVDWDRYYYGFVHVVHVGEEDASRSLATAWSWTEETEVAVGYVLSVLWLGVVAGGTRIRHDDYVRRIKAGPSVSNDPPPAPLNNVSVPCLVALASMLAINATEYKHAPGLYNGFAVGAYVAMASLHKIPSVSRFASVSLLAAGELAHRNSRWLFIGSFHPEAKTMRSFSLGWGLALTPFFVGFAGSKCAHVFARWQRCLERSEIGRRTPCCFFIRVGVHLHARPRDARRAGTIRPSTPIEA